MSTALAWICAGLLVYTFILYPTLSFLLAGVRRRPFGRGPGTPRIAILVAARNEAASIEARVRNLTELDYPGAELAIISDGSTDPTAELARSALGDRGVVLELPAPVGKTRALEAALPLVRDADILVFTDATASWTTDTVRALVEPFVDPSVGAVSGLVVYEYPDSAIAGGFRAYQTAIVAHRHADGAWGTLTSVSGSISAIRRSLFVPVPAELSTDLVFPWAAARAGQRAVFVREAVSVERARVRTSRELRSRVRLAISAFAFTAFVVRNLRGTPPGYLFQLFSHKVLRWLSPVLVLSGALAAFLASLSLGLLISGFLFAGCALALLGLVPRWGRMFTPFLFAATVAVGYLWGLGAYALGARPVGWNPDAQR